MSKGYVYILGNPAMPGILKIGRTTTSPENRASQLYQTGVPAPFEVLHSVVSPDCQRLESIVHLSLSDKRLSASREFFECEASLAIGVLHSAHEEQVSEWLEEFFPDHTFIACDLMIDPSDIDRLSEETGEPLPIIARALSRISGSELMPAIKRVYERMQSVTIQRKESQK